MLIVGLTFTAVLAGCNSNSSASVQSPLDFPTYDFTGGYLYGNASWDDAWSSTNPIQIILTEDFQFRAMQIYSSFPRDDLVLRGSFNLDGRLTDGEGVAIAGLGDTWSNGQPVTNMLFTGTLDKPTTSSNGRLLISVSLASGDTFRIDATYGVNSGYYSDSSPAQLVGRWIAAQDVDGSSSDISSIPPLSAPRWMRIDVESDGGFSGVDTDGCLVSGRFSSIDSRVGVWSVEYSQSECSRAGTYTGLTLRDNGWYSTPSLAVSADDGARSQTLEFWKEE